MEDIKLHEHKQLLADQVRRLREYANLSQSSLAEKAGVSIKTIQNIEECKRSNPSLNTIISICDILKMDPRYFIYSDLHSPSRYAGEIADILSDCTETESEHLVNLLKGIKAAMRLSPANTPTT